MSETLGSASPFSSKLFIVVSRSATVQFDYSAVPRQTRAASGRHRCTWPQIGERQVCWKHTGLAVGVGVESSQAKPKVANDPVVNIALKIGSMHFWSEQNCSTSVVSRKRSGLYRTWVGLVVMNCAVCLGAGAVARLSRRQVEAILRASTDVHVIPDLAEDGTAVVGGVVPGRRLVERGTATAEVWDGAILLLQSTLKVRQGVSSCVGWSDVVIAKPSEGGQTFVVPYDGLEEVDNILLSNRRSLAENTNGRKGSHEHADDTPVRSTRSGRCCSRWRAC